MKRLGHVQRDVLDALRQHKAWHAWCGWMWSTPSETARILESLVRAGYVRKSADADGRLVYHPIKGTKED